MSNAIKTYLHQQYVKVTAEIMTLTQRLDMLRDMIADLDDIMTEPPPPRAPKPRGKTVEKTLAALNEAGDDGLTAREVAVLTDLPVGTASGRLSLMKQEGMVRHDADNHKYFAIHSTREDNNLGYSP
jgi:hypothetical protein